MKDKQNSDWKLMIDFLNNRRLTPWKSPSYVFYFLIVIVLDLLYCTGQKVARFRVT